MSFFSRAPREAQTSFLCPSCQKPLFVKRTCYQGVLMFCKNCDVVRPVEEYIPKMDDALCEFLENVNFDRF